MDGMHMVEDPTEPTRGQKVMAGMVVASALAAFFIAAGWGLAWMLTDGDMSWGDAAVTLGLVFLATTSSTWLAQPVVMRYLRWARQRNLERLPE